MRAGFRSLILAVMAGLICLSGLPASAADPPETPPSATLPLPTAVVTFPRLTNVNDLGFLLQAGQLPTVFVIVPKSDATMASVITLAAGLSLEIGVAGRVVLIDQGVHPEVAQAILHPLHRESVTAPLWLFYKPASAANAVVKSASHGYLYDADAEHAPITQATAEAQIARICEPHPIGASEVNAAQWQALIDTSGITDVKPENSFILSIWYRSSKDIPTAVNLASWRPRMLLGVERWKYRKRVAEGDKSTYLPLLRAVVAINLDQNPDLYRRVLGATLLPNQPQIVLFKLAKAGQQGSAIRYKQVQPTDPPASELTESQLQLWLTAQGAPLPDNGNVNIVELELAEMQQQAAKESRAP